MTSNHPDAGRSARAPVNVPVLIYPLHGCAATGQLNEEQVAERLKYLREMLRQRWSMPGVKELIELIEMRGATTQRASVQPGAGAHDQGQAYALMELLGLIQNIIVSVEDDGAGGPVDG